MTESQTVHILGTPDVVVSFDAFPAKVLMPAGNTIEPVRAVIADGNLLVFQVGAAEPQQIFERQVSSTEGSFQSGLAILVWDGIVIVGRAAGCGCGSKLGTADLFPGRRRINTTL